MAEFEETSVTSPDGYKCYARYWPQSCPCAAVLHLPGIQSHCGWFDASAKHLADRGFAVLQVDRRGCGANSIDRGHAESADQLIADAQAAGRELFRRAGTDSYHILGVSWGGKLAVASYVNDPQRIAGLTLVTPGLFPLDGVSKDLKAEIGFAMLYEREKLFDIPLNEGGLFTSVPQWRDFIDSDPQTLRQCTAGFYLASRRMDKVIARLGDAPPVPLHLVLAGDERIIDNARTLAFATNLNWPSVKVTTYPDAHHSVEFEECSADFLGDVVSFIGSTTKLGKFR